MDSNLKIAFFGTPRFAQIVLGELLKSPYQPNIIITAQDSKVGRGRQIKSSLVKQTAQENNIKVIEKLDPKLLGSFDLAILVAYGKILPQEILEIPKHGFLNVHPSLLPKYRGPSPIHSAILSGDNKTGVSLILLDEEVDHGPILNQSEVAITPEDTHETLIDKLAREGAKILLQTLPDYLDGKITPKPQNHTKATTTEHIQKQNGFIHPQNPPDKKIVGRMIRAYFPWPTVWTKLDGKIIKFLPGGLIQPEGKRPMTKKEFLNGYPRTKESIEKII